MQSMTHATPLENFVCGESDGWKATFEFRLAACCCCTLWFVGIAYDPYFMPRRLSGVSATRRACPPASNHGYCRWCSRSTVGCPPRILPYSENECEAPGARHQYNIPLFPSLQPSIISLTQDPGYVLCRSAAPFRVHITLYDRIEYPGNQDQAVCRHPNVPIRVVSPVWKGAG